MIDRAVQEPDAWPGEPSCLPLARSPSLLYAATRTRLSHLSQLIDRLPIRRMAAEPTNALRGSS